MTSPRYQALITEFAGVLTDSLVEVYARFEQREGLRPMTFLSEGWGSPEGQRLYQLLALGEIDQAEWNMGMAALIGVRPEDLMARVLLEMDPAYEMLRLVSDARAAGVKTAVLTNSLGRAPYDPYALYDLPGKFDVVVFSDRYAMRKPDPRIFELTCELLKVAPADCLFVDSSEQNLPPASALGMTTFQSVDEQITVPKVRRLLGI